MHGTKELHLYLVPLYPANAPWGIAPGCFDTKRELGGGQVIGARLLYAVLHLSPSGLVG